MTKGKVVFVTTGDIEDIATSKRAFGMSEPLTRLGYEVTIFLQDTPGNRSRLMLEAPSATPVWWDAQKAVSEARLKRRKLAELKPDIVYVGSYGIRNLVVPFPSARALYVVEHSELKSAIRNQPLSRRAADFILERLAIRAFDGEVCASRYLVDYVKDRLPANRAYRVHYSPYAFSRSVLQPDTESPARVSEGKRRILYMGTLARNYGIFHIMDAVAQLREIRQDFELVVLGKGRHFDEATRYARDQGLDDLIDFRGYVPEADLPHNLSQADVFVAPLLDTVQDIARCPSKMFMYVLFDRPVVTSAIGEAAELFGRDYEFYFEPDNVAQMCERLGAALDTPADWQPPWDARAHEWTARTEKFDEWIDTLRARRGV